MARAEQVSTEHTCDTETKLARQVEVLQNSYSVANDNWREIEKTLLAHVARLEDEVDESSRREADLRRKVKESGTRCRELELRYESSRPDIEHLEEELAGERTKSLRLGDALKKALHRTEELSQRSELGHNGMPALAVVHETRPDTRSAPQPEPSLSPEARIPAVRPSGALDCPGQQSNLGAASSNSLSLTMERPATSQATNNRVGPLLRRESSTSPVTNHPTRGGAPDAYPLKLDFQDSSLDLVTTPATPDRNINDMFSVSTVAAGPSVQLVERMSASVRRLESEKTALREELDRLGAQRGEAREQIVALMEELDRKSAAEEKMKALEEQTKEAGIKLATTLELLGEKSELVEELRADIADMKEIYKSTLENTIR